MERVYEVLPPEDAQSLAKRSQSGAHAIANRGACTARTGTCPDISDLPMRAWIAAGATHLSVAV